MEPIYRVKLKQTYCVDSILSEISLYAVSIFSSLEEAAPGRGVLSMSDPRHTGEIMSVSWLSAGETSISESPVNNFSMGTRSLKNYILCVWKCSESN